MNDFFILALIACGVVVLVGLTHLLAAVFNIIRPRRRRRPSPPPWRDDCPF